MIKDKQIELFKKIINNFNKKMNNKKINLVRNNIEKDKKGNICIDLSYDFIFSKEIEKKIGSSDTLYAGPFIIPFCFNKKTSYLNTNKLKEKLDKFLKKVKEYENE